jgi:hypothetical protein
MANLVVKSNSASTTFNIQQKVIKLPFEKGKVELIIRPKKSTLIYAKDFRVGLLPANVSKVEFEDLGDKVIAIVFIKQKIVSTKAVVLDIPISGTSVMKQDVFNVTELSTIQGGILSNSSSSFPKSVVNDETKYVIKNSLGKKILVFSKTFIIINGFKFTKPPTYTITGNANRYKVVTEFKKNNKKEVISKTFKFYYTSPKIITSSQDSIIRFTARANDKTPQVSELYATGIKENKIYSVNQGVDPGPLGGQKRIVVKGVPGSTFKFLVSDSNGAIYDINSGGFTGTGEPMSGIIPKPKNNKSYGESIIRLNIPRTSAAQTVTTQFFKDEDPTIQNKKIEIAIAKATKTGENVTELINVAQNKTQDQALDKVSLTTPTLVFSVTLGDFLGPKVDVDISGVTTETQQIYLGKEGRETLKITKPGTYDFSARIQSTGRVQLIRQPMFVMPEKAGEDNFVTDGGTPSTAQKLAKLASNGSTKIVSDWDWTTVQENSNILMKMRVEGVGKVLGEETVSDIVLQSYGSVVMRGRIVVKTIGKLGDTIALKLDNFLARKDV